MSFDELQMYVNYYDRVEKTPDENPTIGILLCTAKNDTVVKMSLPENNSSILASQYQLYLPTQDQLKTEVESLIRITSETENQEKLEKRSACDPRSSSAVDPRKHF